MTVRELLARTDSRELSEWEAYFRLINDGESDKDKDKGNLDNEIIKVFKQIDGHNRSR